MNVISIVLTEGFANRMSQYAWARAYAEQHGCQLQTSFWMGQKVFQIDDPPITRKLPLRIEDDFEQWNGQTNIEIAGWGAQQKCLLYSRADARRWFTFRPHIIELLKPVPHHEVAAHLRWGDFVGLNNFIAISKESYLRACDQYGIDKAKLQFICETNPISVPGIDASKNVDHSRMREQAVTGLGFLPDFYALMQADILLRANSTYSYWAAVLGQHKRIFSPDLRGIPHTGTRPLYQDVPFVEGNHMAIGSMPGCHSELHLREV